jgi:hypothetical protein
MNIPIVTVEEGWIPWTPDSGVTIPGIAEGNGTVLGVTYFWGTITTQVGTGLDLFGILGGYDWSVFWHGVLHGVKKPGQSFAACVDQNIKETTGGQVDPQELAKAVPAMAVGVTGALLGKVPFNIPFDPGMGGISAFTSG